MEASSGERFERRAVSSVREESHMSSLSVMSCMIEGGVSPASSSFWRMARMSARRARTGSMSASVYTALSAIWSSRRYYQQQFRFG